MGIGLSEEDIAGSGRIRGLKHPLHKIGDQNRKLHTPMRCVKRRGGRPRLHIGLQTSF